MRIHRFALLCIPLLAVPMLTAAAQEMPAARELFCSGLTAGAVRSAVRVIDGETLALDDGSELRLIGALAPRAIDVGAEPGGWAAENRTREELHAFVAGKSVELGFGGDRQDRYGRLLAHAYVVLDGGQRRWVQGHLLEQGLARAYVLAGNRACASELLAAERPARDARRGLWADAAYQVREADRAAELGAYRGTFQIVEGRIARVSMQRGTTYLNFDRRRREGFSAFLRSGDQAVSGASGHDLRVLEGRHVRVRGWIEGRGAPMLDLSVAGLLEVVDARSATDTSP